MKKKLTHDDLIAFLKAEAEKAGSQKNYAEVLGISAQYLGDILRGRREPGPGLLNALGMTRTVYYEKKTQASPEAQKLFLT